MNDKQSLLHSCYSYFNHSDPVINMENDIVVLSCRNVYMSICWNSTLPCRFNKCLNLFIYLTMITYKQRFHISDDHPFDKAPNTYYQSMRFVCQRHFYSGIKCNSWHVAERVWRYQRDNQNPYIKEHTTQWSNTDLQSITHKTTDRITRTPLKTEGGLMCSGMVSSSCSTNITRYDNSI